MATIEVPFSKDGLVFTYRGGEYIDVNVMGRPRVAIDIINVWDYESGKARVPFERASVREAALEWLTENRQYLSDYYMSAGLRDKPEPGKVYRLTGGSKDAAISNGNTWAESEVVESDEPVLISQYTNEQAIADGIKMEIAPRVYATTNLASRLGCFGEDGVGDIFQLRGKLFLAFVQYAKGEYGSGDGDANFAVYDVGTTQVWLLRDQDGLHFILPEDY